MLVLHDDAKRESPTAPRWAARYQGRHLHPAALRQAKKQNWVVISIKNDWKRVFAFGD